MGESLDTQAGQTLCPLLALGRIARGYLYFQGFATRTQVCKWLAESCREDCCSWRDPDAVCLARIHWELFFCIVRLTEAVSRSDQHCWSEGGRCDSAGDAEWAVF